MTYEASDAIPIGSRGALVTVKVGVPRRVQMTYLDPSTVPVPVEIRLVIDTGASTTLLRSAIFEQLDLDALDQTMLYTPSTDRHKPAMADDFLTDLILDDRNVIRNVRMLGVPFRGHGYDGVLGRDILRFGRFDYDGRRKRWTLEVDPPPIQPIVPSR